MGNQSTVVGEQGMSLRGAALVAGFEYLLNPVSYAEFSVYPRLVIPGHIEQTVQNIGAHGGLFAGAIFCYLTSFIGGEWGYATYSTPGA